MLSEKELTDYYESLTLEDKLGQILQLPGHYFSVDGEITGLENSEFTETQIRHAGSVLGVYDGNKILQIQKEHMKHSKVPLIFMGDVTAGYAVAQTMPLAQACTFSPELVKKMAHSAATAATAQGIKVTFSPMVDISRDARWGRCAESYGEDVCLSSRMAGAMVEGYQGDGEPDAETSMSSCVKHFAAYGYGEAGRDYNNVELSERTLQETFLPAYRAGVEAGCDMMMTSFNTIGGVPVTLNKKLINELLREKWGFNGAVISDWGALKKCLQHRAVNNSRDIAKYGLEAGVDITMADDVYSKDIEQMLENGEISEDTLRTAVMNVLRLKNKKGILENPYRFINGQLPVDMEEHYCIALEGVEKSCVLLKNDGILPLKKTTKIALIGPYAVRDKAFMMWNKRCLPEVEQYRKLPIEAFTRLSEEQVIAESGCTLLECEHFLSNPDLEIDPCYQKPQYYLERALQVAKEADVVVMMIGEHPEQSGESASQTSIALPNIQMELLRKVFEVNRNIATVVFSGRPVELAEVSALSRAVMEAWLCGDAGMEGVANLVMGKTVPSGKLAMSFPYNAGQCPIHYDLYPTGCMGVSQKKFSSRYIDCPNEPLYPFGYGLSYTEFIYSDIHAESDVITLEKPLVLSVDVTNIGSYDAEEVVQLYLQDNCAHLVSRPVRELKDFQRILVKSGETVTVSFVVTEEMLRFHNAEMEFTSEAGEHVAYIGTDSMTQNTYQFRLIK